jgi:hypothetical protein
MDNNTDFTYASLIESISKVSLLLVGLSYIFGFLIVNSHLNSYGITYIDVLKAKYLATGAMFLLLMLLSGISLYPFVLFFLNRESSTKREEMFFSIGSLFFLQYFFQTIAPGVISIKPFSGSNLTMYIMAGLSLVLFMIFGFIEKLSKYRVIFHFALNAILAYLFFELGALWFLVILIISAFLFARFLSDLTKVLSKQIQISDLAWSTIIVVTIIFSLCRSYSYNIYPKVLNEYGGGKPITMTLILTDEKKAKIKIDGLHSIDKKIEDVTLLDEDGEYFFFQKKDLKQIKALRIKKSLVNAILYKEESKIEGGDH